MADIAASPWWETHRITGSRYWLARICPAAFTGGFEWAEGSSYASRAGSALHFVAANLSRLSPYPIDYLIARAITKYELTPAQQRDLKIQVSHLREWLATEQDSGWLREVGYFYDPATGKAGQLEMNYERDYTRAPPGAIAMSLDFMEAPPGLPAMVGDYKTGYWTDAPQDSEQLKIASLAIRAAHGSPAVRARIIKVRAKEGIVPLEHLFEEMDLDIVADEANDVFEAIKKNPAPNPGIAGSPQNHCNRCPAKNSCPASTATKKKKEAA